MRYGVLIIALLFSTSFMEASGQNNPIFPRGEKAPNVTQYVGTIWRTQINSPDSVFSYGTSTVTYAPGSRLNWHKHPGGQMLMVTDGKGFYQERGKVKKTVSKGEVIKCLPNVEHWHGATSDSGLSYIAITPAQNGGTVWLQKVTDQEYGTKK